MDRLSFLKLIAVIFLLSLATPTLARDDGFKKLENSLRTKALSTLNKKFPREKPFTKARVRSMQSKDIMSYTFQSMGKKGSKDRFVRMKVKISGTTDKLNYKILETKVE